MKRSVLLFKSLMLIAIVILIYSYTFDNPFMFDDKQFIAGNLHLREAISYDSVVKSSYGQKTRFVGFLTFALNYHFHQLKVFGYHVLNVSIHILTSFLIWWFVRLLFKSPVLRETKIARHGGQIGFLTALLFACHPVETQAISYISQRIASLATMFYLFALCFYLKQRLMNVITIKRIVLFCMFILSATLGMFTKEIVVTIPFMILLIELMFFFKKESFIKNFKRNKLVIGAIVTVMVLLLSIIPGFFKFDVKSKISRSISSASHKGEYLNPGEYVITQFRVVTTFLKLFVFPLNQSIDYDFPKSESLFEKKAFLSFTVLIMLVIGAFYIRRKYLLVTFGIFWFYLTVLVNFIPRPHLIAEHKLYLISIGLCLAFVSLIFYVFPNKKNAGRIVLIIIGIMAVITFNRNLVYENEITLWSDVVKKFPNRSRGILNLGVAYSDQENFEKAIGYYNQVLTMESSSKEALNSRGLANYRLGNMELAIKDFNRTLHMQPKNLTALVSRGNVYREMGLLDKALSDYNSVVRVDKYNLEAINNRGTILMQGRKYALALEDFNRVVDLDSHYWPGFMNRGHLFKAMKNFDGAIKDYSRIIEIEKPTAKLYVTRGNVYFLQEMLKEALEDYNHAIKLEPEYLDAYYNRFLVYEKVGELDLALGDINFLISKSPKNAYFYFYRSNTYFLKQDFYHARTSAKKAQSLGFEIDPEYMQAIDNK